MHIPRNEKKRFVDKFQQETVCNQSLFAIHFSAQVKPTEKDQSTPQASCLTSTFIIQLPVKCSKTFCFYFVYLYSAN